MIRSGKNCVIADNKVADGTPIVVLRERVRNESPRSSETMPRFA